MGSCLCMRVISCMYLQEVVEGGRGWVLGIGRWNGGVVNGGRDDRRVKKRNKIL